MTKPPFFSIIIPALNEERYIPNLLRDLSIQSFRDFEVIVVDGYSTDKTAMIVSQFSPFKLIQTKTRNVSFQRNLGSKQAKGVYLLFFDADTRIPAYFLDGLKYRLAFKPAEAFTTWLEPDSSKRGDKAIATLFNYSFEFASYVDFDFAFGAMIGCHQKTFKQLKGFNEAITFSEDVDFIRRLIKQGHSFEVYKDPRYTYSLRRFRKEGTLMVMRKAAKLHIKAIIKGYDSLTKPFADYPMLGGAVYEEKQTSSFRLLRRFNALLIHIRKFKGRKTVKQIFEHYFLQ